MTRSGKFAALGLALALAAAGVQAAAPQVKTQAPGYYRLMLGDFEVTALSDGTVDLPASTSGIQLNVYDSKGSLVFQEDLGAQQAGELAFAWDGKLADGTTLPAGGYSFEAVATIDGKPTEVSTYLGANVNSVTLGPNNTMTLNVAGVGPVSLSDIKEIL